MTKFYLNTPNDNENNQEKHHVRTEQTITFVGGEAVNHTKIIVDDKVIKELDVLVDDSEVQKIVDLYLSGALDNEPNEKGEVLFNGVKDIDQLPADTDEIFFIKTEDGQKINFIRKTCPCCNKIQNIEIDKSTLELGDIDYGVLINDTDYFFNLIQRCPDCGYTMLFDNGIDDDMRTFVASEKYQDVVNTNMEEGFKNWLLYASLVEEDGNLTEAGIAFTKCYDYLELKNMRLDPSFLYEAAQCFLGAAEEYDSMIDLYLGIDALRRVGEFDRAQQLLDTLKENFSGDVVDDLVWQEQMHIDLKSMRKEYLDIEE